MVFGVFFILFYCVLLRMDAVLFPFSGLAVFSHIYFKNLLSPH